MPQLRRGRRAAMLWPRNGMLFLLVLTSVVSIDASRDFPVPKQTINTRRLTQTDASKCDGIQCSKHGRCDPATGECSCDVGFSGLDCQLTTDLCPDGQLNATGHCCASGIFDIDGICCGDGVNKNTWRLDRHGRCCNKKLNGCGECGGPGFRDALGTCCKGILDAGELCCQSGMVDECGVCDGTGTSCHTVVELAMNDARKNPKRCLSAFLPTLIDPAISDMEMRFEEKRAGNNLTMRVRLSGGPIKSYSFKEALDQSMLMDRNPCSILRLDTFRKEPSCGNHVCEIGEARGVDAIRSCGLDCPLSFTPCGNRSENGVVGSRTLPCSGNGDCLFAQGGKCACFAGFTGAVCDQCSSGYYALRDSCHVRQSLLISTMSNITETSPLSRAQEVASNEESSGGGNILLIISLAICSMAAFMCLFGFFVFVTLSRIREGENQTSEKDNDPGDSLVSPSSGSTFTAYLRRFREFQEKPPWEGSLERHDEEAL